MTRWWGYILHLPATRRMSYGHLVCKKEQQVLAPLTTCELDGYLHVGQNGNLAFFLLCSCTQHEFHYSICSTFVLGSSINSHGILLSSPVLYPMSCLPRPMPSIYQPLTILETALPFLSTPWCRGGFCPCSFCNRGVCSGRSYQ